MPPTSPRELLTGLVVLTLCLAWVVVWTVLLLRRWLGLPILPPQAPRTTAPWGLVDIIVLIALYLIVNVGVAIPIERGPGLASKTNALLLGADAVGKFVSLVLSILYLRMNCRASWRDLGLVSSNPLREIGLGGVAFLAVVVPVYGLQLLMNYLLSPDKQHPVFEMFQESPSPWLYVLAVLAAVVTAPITEEFFFRAVFQGWLERLAWPPREWRVVPAANASPTAKAAPLPPVETANPYAPSRVAAPAVAAQYQSASGGVATDTAERLRRCVRAGAVVMSAAVFALMHIFNGVDAIALFPLAIVLGLLYQRTGSLWACITLHLLLNAVSLGLFFLSLEA